MLVENFAEDGSLVRALTRLQPNLLRPPVVIAGIDTNTPPESGRINRAANQPPAGIGS